MLMLYDLAHGMHTRPGPALYDSPVDACRLELSSFHTVLGLRAACCRKILTTQDCCGAAPLLMMRQPYVEISRLGV